jgi:hypothetical protein
MDRMLNFWISKQVVLITVSTGSYPALCYSSFEQVTTCSTVNHVFSLCYREPIRTNGIQNCIGTAAVTFQTQSCVQNTHTNTNN